VANGKSGDHPLTDLLHYELEVYGAEADAILRRIAELSSRRELESWWETAIGWSPDMAAVLPAARRRLQELEQRAKDSGWETA
jgi:hypothetical protein